MNCKQTHVGNIRQLKKPTVQINNNKYREDGNWVFKL